MNVLVDTSVWVDHFRNRNPGLITLLLSDRVLVHPMVVAELTCGTPPSPRSRTLADLRMLQPANRAGLEEVLEFVERERLYGLGCGVVDMTLLASTLITPQARLWTLDKRLAKLAHRFDVQYLRA